MARGEDFDDTSHDTVGCETESVICTQCNGSGEGMYEGSTCSTCKGSGEVLEYVD